MNDVSHSERISDICEVGPTVRLSRLPKHVCDILFADQGETEDGIEKVSGIFVHDGKEIHINNSFKRRRWDDVSSSSHWMTVLPNTQDSDSGIGTEDGSEFSKDDNVQKKVQRWKGADEQGEYEVQKIVDHRFDQDGRDQFFVKWVGWGDQFNTWEPLSNLNCDENLNNFIKKMINDILLVKWRPVPSCKRLTSVAYRSVIEMWIASTSKGAYTKKLSTVGFNCKGLGISSLARLLEEAVHDRCSKRREQLIEKIKDQCALLRLKEARKEQLELLKAWENRLNSIGPGGLSVENQVDLEGPPKDFMFITDNQFGEGLTSGVMIGEVAGCECIEECGSRGTCCPNMAGVDWAYSANSRLIVSPRSGIFECNRLCPCGPECPNRVIQRGRTVKLCIFRTANGRGWGLKAGESIERGAFLTTYLGEIITSEEAAARDENYEKTGLSYLFDLDMMDPDEGPMYTIDAMKCGNESHFINHSCNPNAHVAGVWIETNDPAVPLLALFARRAIRKGEEITFNYQGDQEYRGREDHSGQRKAKKCKCGTRFCKGFYF